MAAQASTIGQAIATLSAGANPPTAEAIQLWTQIVTQIYLGITTGALITPILVAPPTGGPCVGTCTIT
jgi:hypothetical protein